MTQLSKRELEHAVEELDPVGEDAPRRILIQNEIVDSDGDVVETREKVIDL